MLRGQMVVGEQQQLGVLVSTSAAPSSTCPPACLKGWKRPLLRVLGEWERQRQRHALRAFSVLGPQGSLWHPGRQVWQLADPVLVDQVLADQQPFWELEVLVEVDQQLLLQVRADPVLVDQQPFWKLKILSERFLRLTLLVLAGRVHSFAQLEQRESRRS